MEYISKNEEETSAIAREIASSAVGGNVYALNGDLGTGKTTFVREFAKSLGIKEVINSPTFVIVKKYQIRGNPKVKNLIHMDCYRLNSVDDLEEVGFYESVKRRDCVVMIEWADKIKEALPDEYLQLSFRYLGENERRIEIIRQPAERRQNDTLH